MAADWYGGWLGSQEDYATVVAYLLSSDVGDLLVRDLSRPEGVGETSVPEPILGKPESILEKQDLDEDEVVFGSGGNDRGSVVDNPRLVLGSRRWGEVE